MDWTLSLFVLLAFGAGIVVGVIMGRWYERYLIYDNLLRSQDPESWTAAHRVRVGDAARYPKTERAGDYAPTPAQPFPALQAHEEPFPPGEANPLASAPTVLAPKPAPRWVAPKIPVPRWVVPATPPEDPPQLT